MLRAVDRAIGIRRRQFQHSFPFLFFFFLLLFFCFCGAPTFCFRLTLKPSFPLRCKNTYLSPSSLSRLRRHCNSIVIMKNSGSRTALHSNDIPSAGNNENNGDDDFPLVDLSDIDATDGGRLQEVSLALVKALQTSGFLLLKTPRISMELQEAATRAATHFLLHGGGGGSDNVSKNTKNSLVISHPSDPKLYCMLDETSLATLLEDGLHCDHNDNRSNNSDIRILADYYRALEETKTTVLRCIAIGLQLPDPLYFSKLHDENNSVLRLLHYPAATSTANTDSNNNSSGNRCKAHSDYGTITLLLTDGVVGLEAYVDNNNNNNNNSKQQQSPSSSSGGGGIGGGCWKPVPHIPGALTVNIGSLLSEWTGGVLKATLHRVAGPRSQPPSPTDADVLERAALKARTSLAFFADPNQGVSITGSNCNQAGMEKAQKEAMTVAEYIQWRSGIVANPNNSGSCGDTPGVDGVANTTGSSVDDFTRRQGVAFTEAERQRIRSSS